MLYQYRAFTAGPRFILPAFLAIAGALMAAPTLPWDTAPLFVKPVKEKIPGYTNPDLEAIYLSGPDYRGKPTKIFAWYGKSKAAPVGKAPAMVLVHGGGGTAFAEWVRLWNARGYHAIAMDTTGCRPDGEMESAKRIRHEWAGPNGWGGFDQTNDTWQDQWPYHAVSAVVRAHTELLSRPEVDNARTGVTGISWGGYLTSMVSGIDPRFHLAMPVYGCGFYMEDSAWKKTLDRLGPAGQEWIKRFDASVWLPMAKMPMLWVNGTIDHFFPMPSWQKSYRATQGPLSLALRVNMSHSHGAGWAPAELAAFADQTFKKGPALPKVTGQGEKAGVAWVTWKTEKPPMAIEFCHTADGGDWEGRWWVSRRIPVKEGNRAEVPVPTGATACFFNVHSADGLLASSEHFEKPLRAEGAPEMTRTWIDEDFEGDPDGWTPVGVTGADRGKGASIAVVTAPSPNGRKCLAFVDAPGLSKPWEPLREFAFKGRQAMTNGTVSLSFDYRNDPSAPSRCTVEMRDNTEKAFRTGPNVEFAVDGKINVGTSNLAVIPPGTWVHVDLSVRAGIAGADFDLTLTPAKGASQKFFLHPQNGKFSTLHWLGFITGNEGKAAFYIDNLKLVRGEGLAP